MNKILILVAVIAILAFNSLYVIVETQQALVLQFGNPIKVETEAGLNWKKPFIQNVIKFDKRVLELNVDPEEFIASDLKKIDIDAFAKYRIIDPLKFHQRVRDENGIRGAVGPILKSRLREVIGTVPLNTLLTDKRSEVMDVARKSTNKEVEDFGIEMVDVRIMRADLPEDNTEFVYKQMRTNREREAKEYRALGAEEAQRITAKAEKDRTILLANAKKKAQVIRGEGDGEATRITAEAFGIDKEFYTFYRSMEAYSNTLKKGDTSMVLSPDSQFLRYFSNSDGADR